MKVNTTGIQLKMSCCVGSACGGLSRICTHIVMPMMIGQMPRCARLPTSGSAVGSQGIRPNSVKILVGSCVARSWIQPKNGACRMSRLMKITV